ncbi:MAG: diguanylate cyclase [Lachnospiraceae bacterium]|nr:diguanylate cyclase [Lachnospiraceae bacterium]
MRKFKSLRFHTTIVMLVTAILITSFAYRAAKDSMAMMQNQIYTEQLTKDLMFLEEGIDRGAWSLSDDGFLYKGNTCLGDGTKETANIDLFTTFEDKTGTFCYVFKIDNSTELGYVEGDDTSEGYYEGHFLRVAGSTLSPTKQSIVGTYMSKDVSDVLDRKGKYSGVANVAGGMIFCAYSTIMDENGCVIGATVVGRSVTALQNRANFWSRLLVYVLVILFIISFLLVNLIIQRIIANINKSTYYIKEIDLDHLPSEPLDFKYEDEFSTLAQGINNMVSNLKQTEALRREAETDTLTNIPNRLGLTRHVGQIFRNNDHDIFAVSVIDIDFFKQYNDNYGHQEGDVCIQSVANVLTECTKDNDNIYCARFGGDEFVIIYHNVSRDIVHDTAEKIKQTLQELAIPHEFSQISDRITVSHGAFYGDINSVGGYEKFLHFADQALYKVKESGRNNYLILP